MKSIYRNEPKLKPFSLFQVALKTRRSRDAVTQIKESNHGNPLDLTLNKQ